MWGCGYVYCVEVVGMWVCELVKFVGMDCLCSAFNSETIVLLTHRSKEFEMKDSLEMAVLIILV